MLQTNRPPQLSFTIARSPAPPHPLAAQSSVVRQVLVALGLISDHQLLRWEQVLLLFPKLIRGTKWTCHKKWGAFAKASKAGGVLSEDQSERNLLRILGLLHRFHANYEGTDALTAVRPVTRIIKHYIPRRLPRYQQHVRCASTC